MKFSGSDEVPVIRRDHAMFSFDRAAVQRRLTGHISLTARVLLLGVLALLLLRRFR